MPAKKAKYYAPISTRLPALALILIAILACISTLEYGLRSGLTVEEKSQQQTHDRDRIKRQVAGASSSVVNVATTPAQSSSDSPPVSSPVNANVSPSTAASASSTTRTDYPTVDSRTPTPSTSDTGKQSISVGTSSTAVTKSGGERPNIASSTI